MIGIIDAITTPINIPLTIAKGFFAGLRFLLGILDKEMVIITASRRIVRLLVTSVTVISPKTMVFPAGNTPEKFVMSEITNAAPIMKALLVKSFNAKRISRSKVCTYMKIDLPQSK